MRDTWCVLPVADWDFARILTIGFGADRGGAGGGSLAPLRPGRQPHVVQRVGVQT